MGLFKKKGPPEKKATSNRSRCQHCGIKGICSCLKTLSNLRNSPEGPQQCTNMCQNGGKGMCTRTKRGGVCPCPDC